MKLHIFLPVNSLFFLVFGFLACAGSLYAQRIVSYDDFTPVAGQSVYSLGYGWVTDWQEINDDNNEATGDIRYSLFAEYLVFENLDMGKWAIRDFDLSTVDCNYELELSFGYQGWNLAWDESLDVFLYDSNGQKLFLTRIDNSANTTVQNEFFFVSKYFSVAFKDLTIPAGFSMDDLQGLWFEHSGEGGSSWGGGWGGGGLHMVKIDEVTLTAVNEVSVDVAPADQVVFAGDDATFSVAASNVDTYRWQVSSDNGATWVDIDEVSNPSSITDTLVLTDVQVSGQDERYRVLVSNSANVCQPESSGEAVLQVRVGMVITNRNKTYRVSRGG